MQGYMVTLNNKVEMPQLGFGVFQVAGPAVCEQAVFVALSVGYRSIVTAGAYGSEEAVGAAVKRSGLARGEIFLASKAYIQEMGYEKTR